ncbi:MAG: crossover junction endodeoxyribonuclease RuvC [Oscillospiraceae bacterium]|jgi:crossover junction endodeoxyribonuclease RuvC|nr:crossover junction endodeoxyribonuclease RuvC [Oscillospiraceae bacterium]
MLILGVDPGYATIGCGIVDYKSARFKVVDYRPVLTSAGTPFPERLRIIYEEMDFIIKKYRPESIAIEKVFFNTNSKTAIDVSQARGVIILAAAQNGLSVNEYTPLQVKQSVVGYGQADKNQVMEMTRIILNLSDIPKPDDVADALALAICHAHNSGSGLDPANLKIRRGI